MIWGLPKFVFVTVCYATGASDVFKSAVDRGTKAWGENTALTEEANKRYETTESQLKMLKMKQWT